MGFDLSGEVWASCRHGWVRPTVLGVDIGTPIVQHRVDLGDEFEKRSGAAQPYSKLRQKLLRL